MKLELFILLIAAVFVTKGQEATYALSDATKEDLLKLVEGMQFMNDRANEIVQIVEFQMKSINASANLNLAETNAKTTEALDKVTSNREYKKCIDRERVHLRLIIQIATADVNQCLRTGITRAQALRNNTVQPFDGIRLNRFIEKCIIRQEHNGCSEGEADAVKTEFNLAFKMAYQNLYKAGSEVKPLAEKTLECVNNKVKRAETEANNFLDATMKKCVEAK